MCMPTMRRQMEQYMSICTHMQEMKKVCIRIPMRGTHIRMGRTLIHMRTQKQYSTDCPV